MSAHELSIGQSDEWYTPPEVFLAMRMSFDMDVASPGADVAHWVPAGEHITSDSLARQWRGRIWMNPPFGGRNAYLPWAEKFVQHGHGIALAPDRTSAPWWQWFAPRVHGILFWAPKIKFIKPDGTRGEAPGTGTCLFAMGKDCVEALSNIHGVHGVYMRTAP